MLICEKHTFRHEKSAKFLRNLFYSKLTFQKHCSHSSLSSSWQKLFLEIRIRKKLRFCEKWMLKMKKGVWLNYNSNMIQAGRMSNIFKTRIALRIRSGLNLIFRYSNRKTAYVTYKRLKWLVYKKFLSNCILRITNPNKSKKMYFLANKTPI